MQKNVPTEVPKVVDGKMVKKIVKAKRVISFGVGDYTNVQTIMTHIEDYSRFSGNKMQEAIKLMETKSDEE